MVLISIIHNNISYSIYNIKTCKNNKKYFNKYFKYKFLKKTRRSVIVYPIENDYLNIKFNIYRYITLLIIWLTKT